MMPGLMYDWYVLHNPEREEVSEPDTLTYAQQLVMCPSKKDETWPTSTSSLWLDWGIQSMNIKKDL
jgi:hypothetical protein